MLTLAANFPDGSGYVLAAYLVFFAILLIYLGITVYRMLGLQTRLTKVSEELDRAEAAAATAARDDADEKDPVA
jgi:F0F1-type ATP synthase membrane subunit b/b'